MRDTSAKHKKATHTARISFPPREHQSEGFARTAYFSRVREGEAVRHREIPSFFLFTFRRLRSAISDGERLCVGGARGPPRGLPGGEPEGAAAPGNPSLLSAIAGDYVVSRKMSRVWRARRDE